MQDCVKNPGAGGSDAVDTPTTFLTGAAPLEPKLDAAFKAWKAAERHLLETLAEVQGSCRHPQVLHEIDGWSENRRTCVVCGLTEEGLRHCSFDNWSRSDRSSQAALRDAPGRLIVGVTGSKASRSRIHFQK